MLERFTVDLIADEVATELLSGRPTSRLLRRFYRQGRRDGRHAHDPVTMAMLIKEAVRVAASGLCEEYVGSRDEAVRELVHLDAVAARPLTTLVAAEPVPTVPANAVHQEPLPPSPEGLVHGGGRHPDDGDEELHAALLRRRVLRAHRQAQRLAIDARTSTASVTASVTRGEREVADAMERRAETQAAVRRLRSCYVERFNAIARAGSLLWARYCNGFEVGYVARRSRGSVVKPPRDELSLDLPDALLDDAAFGASSTVSAPTTNEARA